MKSLCVWKSTWKEVPLWMNSVHGMWLLFPILGNMKSNMWKCLNIISGEVIRVMTKWMKERGSFFIVQKSLVTLIVNVDLCPISWH